MSSPLRQCRAIAVAALLVTLPWATGCGPRRDASVLEIGIPTEVKRGIQLDWERVNGADGYRMVFTRMTGVPVCTLFVDQMKKPSYVLVRDSLPAPLLSRWELLLEIRAMRHGEPMAAAGIRPLKTP